MIRRPIRRKRPTARRTVHPIRPVDEHVPQADDPGVEAAAYARCHKRLGCGARCAPGCTDRNDHAHHRLMRSQGGPTTDVNLLNVCRPCHTWIHDHPQESYALGLLVPSRFDPAEWPVGGPP